MRGRFTSEEILGKRENLGWSPVPEVAGGGVEKRGKGRVRLKGKRWTLSVVRLRLHRLRDRRFEGTVKNSIPREGEVQKKKKKGRKQGQDGHGTRDSRLGLGERYETGTTPGSLISKNNNRKEREEKTLAGANSPGNPRKGTNGKMSSS